MTTPQEQKVTAGKDCPHSVVLGGEQEDCSFPRGHQPPHSWAVPAVPDGYHRACGCRATGDECGGGENHYALIPEEPAGHTATLTSTHAARQGDPGED